MNRVEIEGAAYVAKSSPAGTCAGCAAFVPTTSKTTPLCLALPACGSGVRDDRRSVVWVKEAAK